MFLSGGGEFWTAVAVTAVAGVAVLAALLYTTNRRHLQSPWSRRKRKHALAVQQWKSLFTPDEKLQDGGVNFLKKVRSGGVDPNLRAEVWPFLLGVYDLSSTKEERHILITQKRKEYQRLRRQCRRLIKRKDKRSSDCLDEDIAPPSSQEVGSARKFLSSEDKSPDIEFSGDTDSSDPESPEDLVVIQATPSLEGQENVGSKMSSDGKTPSSESEVKSKPQPRTNESFATWQRIIRLDAVRANPEWIPFCTSEAKVSYVRAYRSANAVGLKDYNHLEPSRIYHAARLVAILEAYAAYDPEIGYCQGMSDLLCPIITVVTADHEAFWCFVGFMKKARDNFRLDEVGIRRQLNIVSKIIRCKDSRLFRHLKMLQAEDCFFVYRMVVVMFRRGLTFEQTLCLWEVMWADQAAIRAGIGKSAWSKLRLKVPPTEDLLLYAIAASVLQKRKLIIEKYSSMDEIMRECNSMAGQLDIWKLLDDAHNLVVNLHDKVETPF